MESISLNGTWRATENLGLQAKAGNPQFDDAGWTSLPVPGHWQDVPAFAHFTGRLLYRRTFEWDEEISPSRIYRLRFDGIFYYAKVWLNGTFLGEHEGYFAPASYDITRHLRSGPNAVMVELFCPAEESNAKRMITGILTDWHLKDPLAEPGGIWRGVFIDSYHQIAPEQFDLHTKVDRLPRAPLAPDEYERLIGQGALDPPTAADEGPSMASVSFALEFTGLSPGKITWEATVSPETFVGEPVTMAGSMPGRRGWNRMEASVSVPEPRLWWTWDHGEPDLYRFRLAIRHDEGAPLIIERVIGFRRIELRNWHFYLNGRRIFIRGTNYGPPDTRLARVRPERYKEDLALVRGANLNMVRVHAHIDKPELYEEASRQGVLLWQDFPLQWSYTRAVLPEAKRQAEEMVRLLGNWPAIGVWCCQNEPTQSGPPVETGALRATLGLLSSVARGWNKSTLSPAVAQAIRKQDRSRPIITHAGDAGIVWGGADTHHYWGWYRGKVEELERVLRLFPQTARFVTEYGAQAFPVLESTRKMARGTWPQINWSELNQRYHLQQKVMERHVPADESPTLEHYVAATQAHQAHLIRQYGESLRRKKYRPCGGALQFLFADSAPGVSFAVIDYWRQAKPGYEALRHSMNPVYICTDPPRPAYPIGGAVELKVYLINDRYRPGRGQWSWRLTKEGQVFGESSHPAYIPPDGHVVIVGGVTFPVTEETPLGTMQLTFRLELEGEEPVENHYPIVVSGRVR